MKHPYNADYVNTNEQNMDVPSTLLKNVNN